MIRKARKKPVEIEWISYEDFVEQAREDFYKAVKASFEVGVSLDYRFKGTKCYLYVMKNWGNAGINPSIPMTDEEIKREIVYVDIGTLEGEMKFTKDAVLIIGVKGEIYPCRKDIFEMTYDVLGDD
jgi:hypothetical protein